MTRTQEIQELKQINNSSKTSLLLLDLEYLDLDFLNSWNLFF